MPSGLKLLGHLSLPFFFFYFLVELFLNFGTGTKIKRPQMDSSLSIREPGEMVLASITMPLGCLSLHIFSEHLIQTKPRG